MARRLRASLPHFASVELKDLIQAGNVGLVNAVNAYSPTSGVPFEMYARFRIRGEMLDSLRKLDASSRTLRLWQKKLRRTIDDLTGRLKRDPTEEEICQRLGMEVDNLRRKTLEIRAATAVTRCAHGNDRMEIAGREQASPSETRPDSLQSELERRKIMTFAISQLPDRSRKIIRMYYQEDYTMREIAAVLRVDESRVSQIHKVALRRMAENLRLTGITSPTDL